ncbi:MAG: TetR/AcrR family transcriptional regulator [Motilibacteraceae bacterium]
MTGQLVAGARRGPGRPRADEGPVLRREDLLTAAAREFAKGYGQTSVRALARELGVSLAAVQHHAPTKESLLDAVMAEVVLPQMRADRSRLEQAARERATEGPDVEALVLGRIRSLVVHGAVVASVLLDEGPGAAPRRARVLAAVDPERLAVLAVLDRLADVGVIRRVDPAVWTAVSLFAVPAVGRGLSVLPLLSGTGAGSGSSTGRSPEDVLAGLADLLVRGLLPGASPTARRRRAR